MRRLHTADWRSRTATARLPRVLAQDPTGRESLRLRVLGRHPNNFAEHRIVRYGSCTISSMLEKQSSASTVFPAWLASGR
jgi:hypothetical protein